MCFLPKSAYPDAGCGFSDLDSKSWLLASDESAELPKNVCDYKIQQMQSVETDGYKIIFHILIIIKYTKTFGATDG